MDPHDPVARVVFILLRDRLPAGDIESAIESARAVQKEVPESGIGALACEMADKIAALPVRS